MGTVARTPLRKSDLALLLLQTGRQQHRPLLSPETAPFLRESNRQVGHIGPLAGGKAQWFVLIGVAVSYWWGSACPAWGASASATIWKFTERWTRWPGISRNSASVPGWLAYCNRGAGTGSRPVCITRRPPRTCHLHGVLEWSPASPAKVPFGRKCCVRTRVHPAGCSNALNQSLL